MSLWKLRTFPGHSQKDKMEEEKITIDREYVKEKFEEKIHPDDLDRYIL